MVSSVTNLYKWAAIKECRGVWLTSIHNSNERSKARKASKSESKGHIIHIHSILQLYSLSYEMLDSQAIKNQNLNEYEQTNKQTPCPLKDLFPPAPRHANASLLQRRRPYYEADMLICCRMPRSKTRVCFLKALTRKNYLTSFALRLCLPRQSIYFFLAFILSSSFKLVYTPLPPSSSSFSVPPHLISAWLHPSS